MKIFGLKKLRDKVYEAELITNYWGNTMSEFHFNICTTRLTTHSNSLFSLVPNII